MEKYRDDKGRLIRGNIRSAFLDSDDTWTLYDKDGNEVEWPEGWPTIVYVKGMKSLGIEVVT